MRESFHNPVEPFIFDLKQSLDDICEKYGDDCLLDSLAYARKEYGVRQYAELKGIMEALTSVKEHVDGLFEDCLSISARYRSVGDAAQKEIGGGQISLIEMLDALEAQRE